MGRNQAMNSLKNYDYVSCNKILQEIKVINHMIPSN